MVRLPLILQLRRSRKIGVSCFKCFRRFVFQMFQRARFCAHGLAYAASADSDAVGASNEE